MHTYVTSELPTLVSKYFHVDLNRMSISGHSMGGLGALTSYLRHPDQYRCVSAFAPISNPSISDPWGIDAFNKYLGSIQAGAEWDPTIIVKSYTGPKKPMLIS